MMVVLVRMDVMLGLTLEMLLMLMVVAIVVVLRVVPPVPRLFHPSLLPSPVLREIVMVLIVVVVLLVIGSGIVLIMRILAPLNTT